MTTTAPADPTRVLVVSSDSRVATALAELVNALPGLTAAAITRTPCDVDDAVTALCPQLAVIDVAHRTTANDLQIVRRLARRVPVITVSDSRELRSRALAAGAICHCDKDGEIDRLAAALRCCG